MNAIHVTLTCVAAFFLQPVQAYRRYIGDPSDHITRNQASNCSADDQSQFDAGKCAALLRCVLAGLPEDIKAGFQSGGNIVSLIPTILALIGAGPMEIVQLALLSPHRALVTCCFGIGLPSSGLFRQLRPTGQGFSEQIEEAPRTREWHFKLPLPEPNSKRFASRNAVIRISIDIIIVALAAVMLWLNWQVNSRVMITWRCEYGWLLFVWYVPSGACCFPRRD